MPETSRTRGSDAVEKASAPFQHFSRHESAWRSILDPALDAVILIDRDGKVIDWNENATMTFGWTRGKATGETLALLIVPQALREAHQRGLQRYLQTGEAKVIGRHIEITGLRKSGEEFPVELSMCGGTPCRRRPLPTRVTTRGGNA